jgi:ATP-binding cassette, subfamily C (CFTR/MRP), member 1
LAYFLTQFVNALVSANRLSNFFGYEEETDYTPDNTQVLTEAEKEKQPLIPKQQIVSNPSVNVPLGGIHIENGYFSWDKKDLTLKDINLDIKPGQLVCVIGKVGSGKSSLFHFFKSKGLLNAIFNNMLKLKGQVKVNGSLAYCSQAPWMVNATVKDNILFGNKFDEKFYQTVINSCALIPDFQQLPNGDKTEIGENGINVSGGQKHRVSLARACYSGSDIFLLDSPLAAVDVHVGKKLFNDCICGFLSENQKTVILVTHSLQFLSKADVIVMMENGRIKAQGTFDELKQYDENFEKLMTEEEGEEEEVAVVKPKETEIKHKNEDEKGGLTENEEKLEGNLSFKVIWTYFSGYGAWFYLCVLATVLSKSSYLMSGAWLSIWAEKRIKLSDPMFMLIYALLNLSNIGNVFIQRLGFIFGGLRSALLLHAKMLHSILRSPMSFFDTTPTGRILNRFSEDQTRVDSTLNFNCSFLFEYVVELMGTIILISIISPPTLVVIIPVVISYYLIQSYFRKPYREVKRFVEMSRSPLFNHFAASISGTSTIKAYSLEDKFIEENEQRIDYHQRSRWMEYAMARWLSLRLELLGCLIVFGTSLVGVLLTKYLDNSLIAYAVTYALTISENFNWAVRYFIFSESGLINVERIDGYSHLEEERKLIEKRRPPDSWPSKGELVFENLQMRYREGLDLVLKGLNFKIGSNEKIGIVGRTGSGKSSLLLVLFRMVELSGGKLIIDGIDVSTIGLYDLRRNLTIIPQDPTVFSGKLRLNIDPFNKYTDQEIWDALESCHLKVTVNSLKNKLYEEIDEAGSNFSVGERQLLCLCRAVLENQKIVVLDEATANVDHESDMIIQETIREKFKDKTVITIAHRLDTIMDVDKVLVMNAGEILEYDSPMNLINREDSEFGKMVYETGDYSKILVEMAEQAEKTKKLKL